jgi:hypothetical protein
MVQKREMAPVDPGAPAHADLQWLELLAYAHGCCLLHAEEVVAVTAAVGPEVDPPAPAALH